MARDRSYIRLTWGGRLGASLSTPEVWQCGVNLALGTPGSSPSALSNSNVQSLYAGALTTLHSSADAFISSSAYLMWIKAALMDPSGHYVSEAAYYAGTGIAGNRAPAATVGVSPIQSVAVTLWSGARLGKANYGRYYLPWCMPVVDADGYIASTNQTSLRNANQTFLTAVNNWANSLQPGLLLRTLGTGGTTTTVSRVRIGNVLDHQSRRSNRLNEVYLDGAI